LLSFLGTDAANTGKMLSNLYLFGVSQRKLAIQKVSQEAESKAPTPNFVAPTTAKSSPNGIFA